VYVPPGTLHAIGAGVFLVEVQEPTQSSGSRSGAESRWRNAVMREPPR
jgi:hypothetical protein